MSGAKQAKIISLGCRLNISEGERLHAMLAGEENLVVINSCAVTAEAVRNTRQAIRKARRDNPSARLIVTGCAAETERAQITAMDEVDGLIANTAKLDARVWNVAAHAPAVPPRRTRAFVTVQNGCDHACTFCIIPKGRGPSRSLSIDQISREIATHVEAGASEVVLTGVDVTSWGHDLPNTPPLGRLVRAILDRFPEIPRLRMSSLDGVEIDPFLEEMFCTETRLMPHIHLSLQHGDDLILKRMKRRHQRADAAALIERLKARRPDIAIGADIMAGFPTEDEAMHRANLSMITEFELVHGHVFPFSPRESTPAARMPQIDRRIIKARAAELRSAVADIHRSWLKKFIGIPLEVLVERDGTGYAPNFAAVKAPADALAGSIVTIVPQHIEEGLLV